MEEQIKSKIVGKTILVTGGTGSFGGVVSKRLLTLKPKKIIIFSRDEKKQFDMRNEFNNPLLSFIIGDTRDKESVNRAMREGVDYIFHAAALKQVPSCEFFPLEAVKTNILGTQNVLQSAVEYGVERVVVLSTDKAVYPINAMGMSKALMEKLMVATAKSLSTSKTSTCATRYGNVLYSRGSVLPYFVSLIEKGEPLTVTNGAMTRFLLPLPYAVDLVLFGLTHGGNGHTYIKKAPAATIETLAKAMCEIFEYEKGYKEVGIRNGEKMHESLVSQEEMMRAVDLGDYYDIPPESQDLDYQRYFSDGSKVDPNKIEPYTSGNAQRLSVEETIKLLLELPEIQYELERLKNAKVHV
jgi:UDP-N-acetylglucosamine 4,6-dehydratase